MGMEEDAGMVAERAQAYESVAIFSTWVFYANTTVVKKQALLPIVILSGQPPALILTTRLLCD